MRKKKEYHIDDFINIDPLYPEFDRGKKDKKFTKQKVQLKPQRKQRSRYLSRSTVTED